MKWNIENATVKPLDNIKDNLFNWNILSREKLSDHRSLLQPTDNFIILTRCCIRIGLYIIYLLMAYRLLLLNGRLSETLPSVISGTLGLLALFPLIVIYLFKENSLVEEVLLGIAALGLFHPHLAAKAMGFFISLGIYILQRRSKTGFK